MRTLLKLLGITVLVTVIGFIISCGGGGGGGPGTITPTGEKPEVPHGGDPACSHNWSDWLVIYIPIETVPGTAVPMTEKRTCSICGQGETRSTTTFTPTVIIDLTTGDVTGTANTASLPDITITPVASDVVLIIGDGSNGGTGRNLKINNAEQIYIADGAIIKSTTNAAFTFAAESTTITGGGNVVMAANNNPVLITNSGGLTISGTISEITNGSNSAINVYTGSLTISGTIGAITSNTICIGGNETIISGTIGDITSGTNICINVKEIIISGTIGDITSGTAPALYLNGAGVNSVISGTIGDITSGSSSAIYCNANNLTISGTTGAIKSTNGSGINGGSGSITISGKTGIIKGGDSTSGAGGPGISTTTGTVTITGTVEDIKGGLGNNSPLNDGHQISVNGVGYDNWPDVKAWP